jgi:hypothetical protein
LCFLLGLVPGVYSDFTPVALNFFGEWEELLISFSDLLHAEKDYINSVEPTLDASEEMAIPDLFASSVC